MSFKFGCFGCSKENHLKMEGQNQSDDLRGCCCSPERDDSGLSGIVTGGMEKMGQI